MLKLTVILSQISNADNKKRPQHFAVASLYSWLGDQDSNLG